MEGLSGRLLKSLYHNLRTSSLVTPLLFNMLSGISKTFSFVVLGIGPQGFLIAFLKIMIRYHTAIQYSKQLPVVQVRRYEREHLITPCPASKKVGLSSLQLPCT